MFSDNCIFTIPNNTMKEQDEYWMQQAILQAEKAATAGEVPVGAVLIDEKGLVAAAGNSPITSQDPTAHAEILVLRSGAEKLHNYRLSGTTLYVTLEPCIMCMGAMIHARIKRLVYGATDPKTGAVNSLYSIGSDNKLNHSIDIKSGVLGAECSVLLHAFFQEKRKKKKIDQP